MPGFARFPALFSVLSVCSLLSGCMAAHSVVAPMLQSGIQTAAEVNATPESMGVSTAEYRGRDCASLKELADALNVEKTKPEHEALVAKAIGWRADAIHQVRAEQHCDNPAQVRPAIAAQVPMYGFCWYTSNNSRRHFVSTLFPYADWYADRGGREQQQYNALLKTRYGQPAASATCQGEDSQSKAEASRQHILSMFPFANVSNTNVPFTPTAPAPQPQVVASTPKPGAAGVPAQGAFRARFDAVTPAFAQSLGLESPGGALVIDTEKGSTAEKAGLRPLDIITEVEGQRVQTPADLQAIVGRIRPGYKAAVRVWRKKAMHDMVVEVAAPAR
ncbi:S1C family serine protease [Rhodoferax sp.]|uniref:S1C family serine protease n=1 Tax=Rhodoferax sp. TaxID=50421 RepID=UPI002717AB5C|nr:PDZ domain-containing protein [Rhodoferax sp.]MDO9195252.1 PDZ domain-containing protein [Rhodoferax sp.]